MFQPRGKYDSIVDHLVAVADREEKKAGGFCKIDQFLVVALRGFGLHKTVIGTGTYGAALEQCIRRQEKSERDRIWNKKVRIVSTNRIARAAATGRFGFHPGEGGEGVIITLVDCFPMGGSKYKGYVWGGDKLEAKGGGTKYFGLLPLVR